MNLVEEGEELEDVQKIPTEEILKRWMNYHLVKAGQSKIKSLGSDLEDSSSFLYVLNQLDASNCTLDDLDKADDETRAQMAIDYSKKLGCKDVVGLNDILKGNPKVNLLFVAEMFNTKHGLKLTPDEEEVFEDFASDKDNVVDSREERAFRFWINSLGISNVFIRNLYEDLNDGIVLCKFIHKIDKTAVQWDPGG